MFTLHLITSGKERQEKCSTDNDLGLGPLRWQEREAAREPAKDRTRMRACAQHHTESHSRPTPI